MEVIRMEGNTSEVFTINVAGVKFDTRLRSWNTNIKLWDNYSRWKKNGAKTDKLYCVNQYSNTVDPEAILVTDKGKPIGYIPDVPEKKLLHLALRTDRLSVKINTVQTLAIGSATAKEVKKVAGMPEQLQFKEFDL
jgi:hypothetical protein